jgi:hypothetical protein
VITAVLIRNDDNIQLQEDTQCGDHNIIPFLVMRLLLVLCNHPIVEFQLFVLSLPRLSIQRVVEQYAGGGCSYGCMSDRIVQKSTAVIAMLVVLSSSSNSFSSSSSSSFPSYP